MKSTQTPLTHRRLLQGFVVGSPQYYGCLVILIGTGVIVGVVWSFALCESMLRSHPATETEFWRAEFDAQARLLRRVPLWYLTPILAGAALFAAPTSPADAIPFALMMTIIAAVFAYVTWLNRHAAAAIDEQASQLGLS